MRTGKGRRGAALVETLMVAGLLSLAAGAVLQLALYDLDALRVQELAREGARFLHLNSSTEGGRTLEDFQDELEAADSLELDRAWLRMKETPVQPQLGMGQTGGNLILNWLLGQALSGVGAKRVSVDYESARPGLLRFLGPRRLSAEGVVITGTMKMKLW